MTKVPILSVRQMALPGQLLGEASDQVASGDDLCLGHALTRHHLQHTAEVL